MPNLKVRMLCVCCAQPLTDALLKMSGPFGPAGAKPSWYHGPLDRHLAEVKLHVSSRNIWSQIQSTRSFIYYFDRVAEELRCCQ